MVSKSERSERKRLMMKKRLKERQITKERRIVKREPQDDLDEPVIEIKRTEETTTQNNKWEKEDTFLVLIVSLVLFIFFSVAFFGLKTQ